MFHHYNSKYLKILYYFNITNTDFKLFYTSGDSNIGGNKLIKQFFKSVLGITIKKKKKAVSTLSY